jgi:hypothetical protein
MKAMYIILDCLLGISVIGALWLFVVLLFSLN